MAHDDGRSTCWEPIVATPPSCIGISPAQCAKDLYQNPVPAPSTPKSYKLEFLGRCHDGSDSCPLTEELRCTDGSRPAFYYQPGSNDKWIFFSGGEGGPCSAANAPGECFDRIIAGKIDPHAASLTSRWAPRYTDRGGILSENPAINPLFDYNKVVFERCHAGDSGRNLLADQVTSPAGFVYNYVEFHRGRSLWHALFEHLSRDSVRLGMDNFDLASQILLIGHSDSGKGMINSGDALTDYLENSIFPTASVDIRLALDGYLLPSLETEFAVGNNSCASDPNGNGRNDFYDGCTQTGFLPQNDLILGDDQFSQQPFTSGRLWARNVGQGTILDESCELIHGAGAPECHDPIHTLMNHISTPLFIRMDLRDAALLNDRPPPHSVSPDTYGLPAGDFEARVWQTAQDLLEFGIAHAEETPPYQPAFYIPSDGGPNSHTGLTTNSTYTAALLHECANTLPVGSPIATSDFISAWLTDDPAVGVYQALHRKDCVTDTVTWAPSALACGCPP
ncbi:MAG: pectin acetylesterase-family hydrolase [Myxococcota bacterium]|nr:pectin acetylesterase-family hydrolase [Myxococcota bacterium]